LSHLYLTSRESAILPSTSNSPVTSSTMLSKEFCRRSRVKISNSVSPVGLAPRPLSSSLLALGVSPKTNPIQLEHYFKPNGINTEDIIVIAIILSIITSNVVFLFPSAILFVAIHVCDCRRRQLEATASCLLTIIISRALLLLGTSLPCCRQAASFFLQFLGTIKLATTQTQWDASQGTSCLNISARSIRDSHLLGRFPPRRSLNRAEERGRDRDLWAAIHLINGLH